MKATANVISSVIPAEIQSPLESQKRLFHGPDPASLREPMTTKAVFFDALGTLVELEPPWVHLAAAARDRARRDRGRRAARRDDLLPRALARGERRGAAWPSCGRPAPQLLDARARTDGERRDADGVDPLSGLPRRGARRSPRLRERGLARLCVSNWDIALPEVLERVGLAAAARRGRHLGGGRRPQARPGDLRRRARARRLRRRARRCTSATRRPRTSTAPARRGSRTCCSTATAPTAGPGEIASLTEIHQHLRT